MMTKMTMVPFTALLLTFSLGLAPNDTRHKDKNKKGPRSGLLISPIRPARPTAARFTSGTRRTSKR